MLQTRVIPVLLLKGRGLVKGIHFKDHRYVGDPLNAIRIYNLKEADELLFIDITASVENRAISSEWVQVLSKECTMPFGVGGGIATLEEARGLLSAGAEKVCVNTSLLKKPSLISEVANEFGSQSIVAGIDCKMVPGEGYRVYSHCGKSATGWHPVQLAHEYEKLGVGEILVTSIDQDGTANGYDIELIKLVANAVSVPVIACGGAASLRHMSLAIHSGGASAVAAGSFFVFHGPRRAVLISYPSRKDIEQIAVTV